MKKLLILSFFGASMYAMETPNLTESAELIRSLVEGDLEVTGNTVATPGKRAFTLEQFHEGLKGHGIIIVGEEMKVNPTNDFAANFALFFANADLTYLLDQKVPLSQEELDNITAQRKQLLTGLVKKDPSLIASALQGPLHPTVDESYLP